MQGDAGVKGGSEGRSHLGSGREKASVQGRSGHGPGASEVPGAWGAQRGLPCLPGRRGDTGLAPVLPAPPRPVLDPAPNCVCRFGPDPPPLPAPSSGQEHPTSKRGSSPSQCAPSGEGWGEHHGGCQPPGTLATEVTEGRLRTSAWSAPVTGATTRLAAGAAQGVPHSAVHLNYQETLCEPGLR